MEIITNILDTDNRSRRVGTPACLLLPKSGFSHSVEATKTSGNGKTGKVRRGTTAGDAFRYNAKAKADMAATLKTLGLFEHAEGERLELCGKDFISTMSNYCGKTLDRYPAARCGLAYCPDCNIRRRNRELKSVKPKFEAELRDSPALRPYFLTLTLRDRMTQRDANKYLKKQFEKLRDRKVWNQVKGGCYSIQFTVVQDGWNAHLHAVILSERMPSETELSKAWSKLTCGSHRVDIRPIEINELDTVLGYMFKPADLSKMTKEQALEMIDAPAIRTVETFGIVRRSKARPEPDAPAKLARLKVGDACDCGHPECRIIQVVISREEMMNLLDYQPPSGLTAPRAKPRYVH